MQYETAAELAQRLNVTIRTVQLWAKNGKIKGAIKQGRDWLIPVDIEKTSEDDAYAQKLSLLPSPMLNCSYAPGTALSLLEDIEDEDLKTIAMAEYYHCIGEYQKASDTTELFFNNEDLLLRIAACYIYTFANLNLGRINLVRLGYGCIMESLQQELPKNASEKYKASCLFFATSVSALLKLPKLTEELCDYIKYLPEGLKLMAYYYTAFEVFKEDNYQKALGIVETAFSMSEKIYPVPMAFLHLCTAMINIALKNVEEAKKHYLKAWDLASPDKFYTIFAEHSILLCGLEALALPNLDMETHQKLTKLTEQFNDSWMKLSMVKEDNSFVENLTTKEFAVAMLANRGWTNEEIANYMQLSISTVKKYLTVVFQKFNISNRNELKNCIST